MSIRLFLCTVVICDYFQIKSDLLKAIFFNRHYFKKKQIVSMMEKLRTSAPDYAPIEAKSAIKGGYGFLLKQ